MLKAQKGKLLIAEPSMLDPVFFKSVVLLTHYDNKEAIGFVLNKRTDVQLHEIIKDVKKGFPVYIGGPVAKNSIHYIHTKGEKIKNSIHIIENLFWGGEFESIKELIKDNAISKKEIRFFAGYSGWGQDQLSNEIKERSWIIKNATTKSCMKIPKESELWQSYIKSMEEDYAIWANMPRNPGLN